MRTDYGRRGTVARILGFLVAYIVAYAIGQAFHVLWRVAPSLDLGFVRISVRLVNVVAALAYAYLVWRIYPLYMRLLVRVGWLKEPAPRQDRGEEP